MENNNTYEAWRVMSGSDAMIKYSSDFNTPEQALDDFFEEYTPEEMCEKGLELYMVLAFSDEEHDNDDVIEILEEYSLEDMMENEKFNEYLFDKFGEERLNNIIKEGKSYEAWRVMSGSDAMIKYSSDFNTPEQALDDFFEEHTPEEMYEKNLELDKALIYEDEENDNDDVLKVFETYNLEEMLQDEKFSEYLFDKFGEERLNNIIKEKEEIELE